MMLALAWLTVSIPFVYDAQQKQDLISTSHKGAEKKSDSNNPFANTTEEKGPTSSTFSEYLLHSLNNEYQVSKKNALNHHWQDDTYLAFHGELTGPPPKA